MGVRVGNYNFRRFAGIGPGRVWIAQFAGFFYSGLPTLVSTWLQEILSCVHFIQRQAIVFGAGSLERFIETISIHIGWQTSPISGVHCHSWHITSEFITKANSFDPSTTLQAPRVGLKRNIHIDRSLPETRFFLSNQKGLILKNWPVVKKINKNANTK